MQTGTRGIFTLVLLLSLLIGLSFGASARRNGIGASIVGGIVNTNKAIIGGVTGTIGAVVDTGKKSNNDTEKNDDKRTSRSSYGWDDSSYTANKVDDNLFPQNLPSDDGSSMLTEMNGGNFGGPEMPQDDEQFLDVNVPYGAAETDVDIEGSGNFDEPVVVVNEKKSTFTKESSSSSAYGQGAELLSPSNTNELTYGSKMEEETVKEKKLPASGNKAVKIITIYGVPRNPQGVSESVSEGRLGDSGKKKKKVARKEKKRKSGSLDAKASVEKQRSRRDDDWSNERDDWSRELDDWSNERDDWSRELDDRDDWLDDMDDSGSWDDLSDELDDRRRRLILNEIMARRRSRRDGDKMEKRVRQSKKLTPKTVSKCNQDGHADDSSKREKSRVSTKRLSPKQFSKRGDDWDDWFDDDDDWFDDCDDADDIFDPECKARLNRRVQSQKNSVLLSPRKDTAPTNRLSQGNRPRRDVDWNDCDDRECRRRLNRRPVSPKRPMANTNPGPVIPQKPMVDTNPGPVILQKPMVDTNPGPVIIPQQPMVDTNPGPVILQKPMVDTNPGPVILQKPMVDTNPGPVILQKPMVNTNPGPAIPRPPMDSPRPFPPRPPMVNPQPFPPRPPMDNPRPFPPRPPMVNPQPFPPRPPQPPMVRPRPLPPQPPMDNPRPFPPQPPMVRPRPLPPQPPMVNPRPFPPPPPPPMMNPGPVFSKVEHVPAITMREEPRRVSPRERNVSAKPMKDQRHISPKKREQVLDAPAEDPQPVQLNNNQGYPRRYKRSVDSAIVGGITETSNAVANGTENIVEAATEDKKDKAKPKKTKGTKKASKIGGAIVGGIADTANSVATGIEDTVDEAKKGAKTTSTTTPKPKESLSSSNATCKSQNVCYGDSDCNGGKCVGAFVGTCNCNACFNFITCTSDEGCGGLKGACDMNTKRCNCQEAHRKLGYPNYFDALTKFCNHQKCDGSPDSCNGLPCTSGRCFC